MKLNVLGIDDFLIEYIVELYIDNKKFQYIKKDGTMIYKLDELQFIFKHKLNYFKESNLEFFNDNSGIIIIFKTNDINNIKNIWLTEISNNLVNENIPILFLQINQNIKNNEIILPIEFLNKYKYITQVSTENDNRNLIKNIINNFIKKIKTLT
jgi:hypothetical protein